ncbi:MAG: dioxygenase [Deferribacteres bacterium]|nr:dioxygenase [candidate division KSB1 bacterium]MCB9501132.1 dioxygenase [Deferribacteres bacterium]
MTNTELSPVLYIPHGGGPMPLLGDPGHKNMVDFLENITPQLGRPKAILVVSAHWEEKIATITSAAQPSLYYDYSGFPSEAYEITYPAPGDPALAELIFDLLQQQGINARLDNERGFDHGMFVPLKIMYQEATIPCVQLSLVHGLDPALHLHIGEALAVLRKQNVFILGSGFSFHNMRAFFTPSADGYDDKNEAFQQWLVKTCTDKNISSEERNSQLIHWQDAPFARYCHPREEHLIPLHVCAGLANTPAELVFGSTILGKKASGFLW